jgi:DNA-binding SARP family transcriptional activator/tetratricopeptide (TPR) repeat protein
VTAPSWRVAVLGPVSVADGPPLPRLDRYLLALLASRSGHLVTVDEIIQALWPSSPPASARNRVQSLVAGLRHRLSASEIITGSDGYRLVTEIDAVMFDRLRAESTVDSLDRALALWRGPAYQDVPLASVRPEARRLDELRLDTVEHLVDLRLDRGEHGSVLATLQGLVSAHPTRQRLLAQLMLALYRSGRQAEALAAYRRSAARLSQEHGLDPGTEVRRLHDLILRDDPSVAGTPLASPAPAGPSALVPAMLPPDAAAFSGRSSELAELDALLADRETGAAPGHPATAVAISAVSGTAGVGKTALAVHWAHRVAAHFPDGQLYANLRGFDPRGRVLDPSEALRGLIEALGTPAERIPADLDAQVGVYRSLLAGKRVLVVVDNVRDAEHARPLLPGSAGCLGVVTSRNALTGLIATDGAHPILLDVLSTVEAWELLAGRLGAARVAAEPEAVEAIIAACARLPLALTIAAARARQTGFSLAAIAEELGDAGSRLDALDAGDPTSQVRSVLSWSYTALTSPAARLFRLLGLYPGPDISAAAVASLAAYPVAEVRPLLTELTRANLLSEHAPGRYTFHDLLRDYASELAGSIDTDLERQAARHRLLSHYVHAVRHAESLFNPLRESIHVPLDEADPYSQPEPLADAEAAKRWLTVEQPVLLAALRQAADTGHDRFAWWLAWSLDTFFVRRGQWHDYVTSWQIGVAAASRSGDAIGQAYGICRLAFAELRVGQHADAERHVLDALDVYAAVGDRHGQGRAHRLLCYLYGLDGQSDRALVHAQQALAHFEGAGHVRGRADALNAIGWYHALLGNHAEAVLACEQALVLVQQLDDREGEAATLDSLGAAYHHAGRHAEAVEYYERSLRMNRDLGYRFQEAEGLIHLGETYHAMGNPDAARERWEAALEILTEMDHPLAAEARDRLRQLDASDGRHTAPV